MPVLCEGLNAFVKFLAWEHKCIFVWAGVGVVFECLLLCTSLLLHTQKRKVNLCCMIYFPDAIVQITFSLILHYHLPIFCWLQALIFNFFFLYLVHIMYTFFFFCSGCGFLQINSL